MREHLLAEICSTTSVENSLALLKTFLRSPRLHFKMDFKSNLAVLDSVALGARLALLEPRQLERGFFGKDVCRHE